MPDESLKRYKITDLQTGKVVYTDSLVTFCSQQILMQQTVNDSPLPSNLPLENIILPE